jgi:hypothetical protein
VTKLRPVEFKWRQFEPRLILMAVGWYLRFSLSYRDVEELLQERGMSADGSIAKITVETKAMFYGFRQMPYLRGLCDTRPSRELLETEFRNGTPLYSRPTSAT